MTWETCWLKTETRCGKRSRKCRRCSISFLVKEFNRSDKSSFFPFQVTNSSSSSPKRRKSIPSSNILPKTSPRWENFELKQALPRKTCRASFLITNIYNTRGFAGLIWFVDLPLLPADLKTNFGQIFNDLRDIPFNINTLVHKSQIYMEYCN